MIVVCSCLRVRALVCSQTAAYLKTQGVDPRDHPVREELGRVQEYMKKVKGASSESAARDSSSKLNVDAANRFISAGLNNPAVGAPKSPAVGKGAPPLLPAAAACLTPLPGTRLS